MEVCRRRDVPRQDVAVGIVCHRIFIEAQIDLGREKHEAGRTDRIDPVGRLEEHRVSQAAPARVASEEDTGRRDPATEKFRVDF